MHWLRGSYPGIAPDDVARHWFHRECWGGNTMNRIPGLNWLTVFTTRRTQAPPGKTAPDPGDMGTAFGLDASMGAADSGAPTAGLKARAPWNRRLVRRPQR
jgi:hypothetical protein